MRKSGEYLRWIWGVMIMPAMLFSSLEEEYQKGKEFSMGSLPQNIDVGVVQGEFLQSGDTASLEAFMDNPDALRSSGASLMNSHPAVQGEEGTNLLISSSDQADHALRSEKLSVDTPWIKNSMEIEENPAKILKGNLVSRGTTYTVDKKEKCKEGVQFDVDLVWNLTYHPPPKPPHQKITLSARDCFCFGTPYVRHSCGTRFHRHCREKNSLYSTMPSIGYQCGNTGEDLFGGVFQRNLVKKYLDSIGNPVVDIVSGQKYTIPPDKYETMGISASSGPRGWYRGVFLNNNYMVVFGNQHFSIDYDLDRKEEDGSEEWTAANPQDELLIEQNACYESARVCLDNHDRHFDEMIVTRPCWQQKITYRCETEPKEGCKQLIDNGCEHQSSQCLQWDPTGRICLQFEHTYLCTRKERQELYEQLQDSDFFCLDGKCHTPMIEANTDMVPAVAHLAVLQQMQKDMSGEPVTIFRGECSQCTKHLISFSDCCASMKGWGNSIGLHKCNAEEQALAHKRDQGLCHYVGTYCAEKVLGKCIRKKSAYCCFTNKIARVIHEQARPQIGKSWGEPKEPNCSPFTVEELQRVDFSRIDLSEIFADVFSSSFQTLQQKGELEALRAKKAPEPESGLSGKMETDSTGITRKKGELTDA